MKRTRETVNSEDGVIVENNQAGEHAQNDAGTPADKEAEDKSAGSDDYRSHSSSEYGDIDEEELPMRRTSSALINGIHNQQSWFGSPLASPRRPSQLVSNISPSTEQDTLDNLSDSNGNRISEEEHDRGGRGSKDTSTRLKSTSATDRPTTPEGKILYPQNTHSPEATPRTKRRWEIETENGYDRKLRPKSAVKGFENGTIVPFAPKKYNNRELDAERVARVIGRREARNKPPFRARSPSPLNPKSRERVSMSAATRGLKGNTDRDATRSTFVAVQNSAISPPDQLNWGPVEGDSDGASSAFSDTSSDEDLDQSSPEDSEAPSLAFPGDLSPHNGHPHNVELESERPSSALSHALGLVGEHPPSSRIDHERLSSAFSGDSKSEKANAAKDGEADDGEQVCQKENIGETTAIIITPVVELSNDESALLALPVEHATHTGGQGASCIAVPRTRFLAFEQGRTDLAFKRRSLVEEEITEETEEDLRRAKDEERRYEKMQERRRAREEDLRDAISLPLPSPTGITSISSDGVDHVPAKTAEVQAADLEVAEERPDLGVTIPSPSRGRRKKPLTPIITTPVESDAEAEQGEDPSPARRAVEAELEQEDDPASDRDQRATQSAYVKADEAECLPLEQNQPATQVVSAEVEGAEPVSSAQQWAEVEANTGLTRDQGRGAIKELHENLYAHLTDTPEQAHERAQWQRAKLNFDGEAKEITNQRAGLPSHTSPPLPEDPTKRADLNRILAHNYLQERDDVIEAAKLAKEKYAAEFTELQRGFEKLLDEREEHYGAKIIELQEKYQKDLLENNKKTEVKDMEISRLEGLLEVWVQNNSQNETVIKTLKRNAKQQKIKIQQLDKYAEEVEEKREAVTDRLTDLQNRFSALEIEEDALRLEIQQRDEKVKELEMEVEQAAMSADYEAESIQQLVHRIDSFEVQLQNLETGHQQRVDQFEQMIKAKDEDIKDLRQKLVATKSVAPNFDSVTRVDQLEQTVKKKDEEIEKLLQKLVGIESAASNFDSMARADPFEQKIKEQHEEIEQLEQELVAPESASTISGSIPRVVQVQRAAMPVQSLPKSIDAILANNHAVFGLQSPSASSQPAVSAKQNPPQAPKPPVLTPGTPKQWQQRTTAWRASQAWQQQRGLISRQQQEQEMKQDMALGEEQVLRRIAYEALFNVSLLDGKELSKCMPAAARKKFYTHILTSRSPTRSTSTAVTGAQPSPKSTLSDLSSWRSRAANSSDGKLSSPRTPAGQYSPLFFESPPRRLRE